MSYTVEQKPSMLVMGIECRTSNDPEEGPREIPLHWQKFYSEGVLGRIPNRVSDEVIALYCDYDGDYTQPYSLVIGCVVNSIADVPAGMVAKVVPGGSYARFNAVGEYPQSLIETWGTIWRQASLPRSYTGDYERYGEKFSGPSKEVEVFIALNK